MLLQDYESMALSSIRSQLGGSSLNVIEFDNGLSLQKEL